MTDTKDAPREAETPDVDLSALQNASDDKRDEIAKEIVEKMFEIHRARLLRMIEVRLQPELRARVEANDVLQEAFIEAYRQLRTGVSAPKGSSFVWLRLIVGQQLVAVYRRYCQTQKRNVAREFSISEKYERISFRRISLISCILIEFSKSSMRLRTLEFICSIFSSFA